MRSIHKRLIRFISVAALICCAGLACTAAMAVATTPVAPIQTSGTTSTPTSTTPAQSASPAAYNCQWIANGAHKPPYGVYIRNAPSTNGATVGVIPNGTVFNGTCNPINGFISTTYNGTFGYVNHYYLLQVVGKKQ